VPTIVRDGAIELKVYPADEQRRHVPHFHVWVGGESLASVRLSDLCPMVGGPLPRRVRQLVAENAELLADAWEELHA
jgi:hypothetical protein